MSANHFLAFFGKYSQQILLAWLALYLSVKLWGSETMTKRFLLLSAAGYGLVLLYMTLLSRGVHENSQYRLDFLWEYRQAFRLEAGRLQVRDSEFVWYIKNNIRLFVPMGVLLSEWHDAYGKNTFSRVLLTGCLVSVSLEISQLAFRMGLFELDDILNNTIGAILGYCFYVSAKKLMQSSRLRNRWRRSQMEKRSERDEEEN